jgi:hypothetical protein
MKGVASEKTNKQQDGVEKTGFMTAMLSWNEYQARFEKCSHFGAWDFLARS